MQVLIRPLRQDELPQADAIFQDAFSALNQGSTTGRYKQDMSYMKRWFAQSTSAFAAEVDGQLVGSNFAIRWGSFGLFGPLTVAPKMWGNGIAQQLIHPAMDCFEAWEVSQAGFFTRSNSPKHLHLYQKFGFFPRFLTAIMSKALKPTEKDLDATDATHYSAENTQTQEFLLHQCRQLTHQIFAGLDVSDEIQVVHANQMGDTIILMDGDEVVAFAVCHSGAGTEAGSRTCYVKFGGIHPEADAQQWFASLLHECEAYAIAQGATKLIAGVSTARQEAYQQLSQLGFQTDRLGVAMHRPNQAAFCQSGLYVIDDWR